MRSINERDDAFINAWAIYVAAHGFARAKAPGAAIKVHNSVVAVVQVPFHPGAVDLLGTAVGGGIVGILHRVCRRDDFLQAVVAGPEMIGVGAIACEVAVVIVSEGCTCR